MDDRTLDALLLLAVIFYAYTSLLKGKNSSPCPSNELFNSWTASLPTVAKADVPSIQPFVYSRGIIQAENQASRFHLQEQFLLENNSSYCSRNDDILKAFISLSKTAPSHAEELFKFCYMTDELQRHGHVRFVDNDSIILNERLLREQQNYVVVDQENKFVHGSLYVLHANQQTFLQEIIDFLVHNQSRFEYDPSILSRRLFEVVHEQMLSSGTTNWILLNLVCDMNHKLRYRCQAQLQGTSVVLTPHHFLPTQVYPVLTNRKTLESSNHEESLLQEYPFITTIVEKPVPHNVSLTKNFHQILSEKRCLPTNRICETCMKDIRGGNCAICFKFCGCFCDYLCKTEVEEKVLSKILEYRPPLYKRNQDASAQTGRLIPKIVHQTWFEPLSKEKYPNFSRLAESWKRSNWEYRFYDDDQAANFISLHFPREVKEAYDALIPGAFKADLFRYCVLFIYGGVYADVDVLLETNLDYALDRDVGFFVPLDSPGEESGHQICLWNGFMASAPGHPFLAAAIETVVNNIRNRFTSVDVMNSMCPGEIDFYVSHRYDILMTTGPCILGASINRYLGRHAQTTFANFTDASIADKQKLMIPGKVILLHSNKNDMGSHRFTLRDKNLIVAATDMEGFDDRSTLVGHDEANHYSKLKKHGRVYGTVGLYKDNISANEVIKFIRM